MIFENLSQKVKGEQSFVHNAVIRFQAGIKDVLEIYQFLGSMLPQYMALSIRFVRKKKS